MVEKFQEILNRILSDRGEVVFLGIFKMDDLTEKWSVIIAANWISDVNRDEVFNYILSLTQSILNEEERVQIARIGIFPVEEHLIEILLNFKTGSRIQDQKVNGNIIHDGYIFASNSNVTFDAVKI